MLRWRGGFGCYLANRRASRKKEAAEALKAAQLAYYFLTDELHSKCKEHPPLELWVGPYVYWPFTEYLDAVGPHEKLRNVIKAQDNQWRVERRWRGSLWRAHGDTVYRSKGKGNGNGILTVSILGYLGLRQMEEIGKPIHLPFPK